MFLATCMCAFILRKPIMTAVKLVAPIVRARLNVSPGAYAHTPVKECQVEEDVLEEELPPDNIDEPANPSETDDTKNIGITQRKKLKFP